MKFRYEAWWLVPAVVLACDGLVPLGAEAQFFQQGPKLVGTGAVNIPAGQGVSVSLSADGNTAIVGGPYDNSEAGAAWVYTGSDGIWNQQAKLVGTTNFADLGFSVSLSADGNTAIVGGPNDNNETGAAWVFTRSGGIWNQQAKLVGTGAIGEADQGLSVSLSADGNTAIVGGPDDNNSIGAAWVYTRSGGVWSQQAKLVGTGFVGPYALQGASVSLSADGETAIVGGHVDNYVTGAAWVYTRSGSVWDQQAKLVAIGTAGTFTTQGWSVSLSADGKTAIVGGISDNNETGAAWIYKRSGGERNYLRSKSRWSQQAKLVGRGVVGPYALQGWSVSLSADGKTAIVGGPGDNATCLTICSRGFVGAGAGAAWVFTRAGRVWTQQMKLVGTGAAGAAEQGLSVSLSADGNTALVGGPDDNSEAGAAWVFAQPVFPGTPGKANCHGQSVSALARQYGGLNNAAVALGFDSVKALQEAIGDYCEA